MLSEDALNDYEIGLDWNDNSKHVSSTFRGVYKRKFDTKWRAEITAGVPSPHFHLWKTMLSASLLVNTATWLMHDARPVVWQQPPVMLLRWVHVLTYCACIPLSYDQNCQLLTRPNANAPVLQLDMKAAQST